MEQVTISINAEIEKDIEIILFFIGILPGDAE